MRFCTKCGERIIEGALFCTKCGTSVDVVSQCVAGETDEETKERQEFIRSIQGPAYFKELSAIVRGIFTRPASTVQEVAIKPYLETSFLLAGILAVLQGLFGIGLIHLVVTNFMGFLYNLAGRPELPYVSAFFCNLAAALLSMGVLFAVIYLLSRYILGSGGEWLNIWNVAVVSAILHTAGVVCLFLFSYVSQFIGLALYGLGSLISMFCVYVGSRKAMGVSDDKAVYVVSIAYIVMSAVVILFVKTVFFNIAF